MHSVDHSDVTGKYITNMIGELFFETGPSLLRYICIYRRLTNMCDHLTYANIEKLPVCRRCLIICTGVAYEFAIIRIHTVVLGRLSVMWSFAHRLDARVSFNLVLINDEQKYVICQTDNKIKHLRAKIVFDDRNNRQRQPPLTTIRIYTCSYWK